MYKNDDGPFALCGKRLGVLLKKKPQLAGGNLKGERLKDCLFVYCGKYWILLQLSSVYP
ncbi:hypothetical protein NC652_036984 [Populus alba x Populus x berolinensis]|nr:hypothetical protein NC652_036984 [Populus alba x Populus x berolinensis]